MLALFAASLPWLIGFRWTRVVAWADAAFGLGLPGTRGARAAARRGQRAVDDASVAGHGSACPDDGAQVEGSVHASDGMAAAVDDAQRDVRRQSCQSCQSCQSRQSRQPANPADAAGGASARQPARRPAAWTPAEPTVPAGWLRGEPDMTPRDGAARPADGVPRRGSRRRRCGAQGASKAPAAARSTGASLNPSAMEKRGSSSPRNRRTTQRKTDTPSAHGTSAPAAGSSAHPAQSPRAPAIARQPAASGRAPSHASMSAASAASSAEAAPSVQETLRSIEENTAQWTTLAGASLARRSHPETAKPASGADDAVRTDKATTFDATSDAVPQGPLEPHTPVTPDAGSATDGLREVADTNGPANPASGTQDDAASTAELAACPRSRWRTPTQNIKPNRLRLHRIRFRAKHTKQRRLLQ